MLDERSAKALQQDPMQIYRNKWNQNHRSVSSKYDILGFISSGTYGRVYKAQSLETPTNLYAIKKFKPDKEGEVVTYTGLSQSAIREIALNREIDHENVVALKEVILEDKSIFMVFEYAEHDFLQIIHHHLQTVRTSISMSVLKSLIYQLLNGLVYLHSCHILHRDLKPANILITSDGVVKIGDLGLARLIYEPLQPLYAGDKVVVTIWYRAPELLLGAKHYTTAVDCWAVGCVMAELLSLRPIFKGEEAKLDSKKTMPFQRDQLLKIFEVLGTPDDWPGVVTMPEYYNMSRLDHFPDQLTQWCIQRVRKDALADVNDLLAKLFTYDPESRLTAKDALHHHWFQSGTKPTKNAFQTAPQKDLPPLRKVSQDDAPSMIPLLPNASHQGSRGGGGVPYVTGASGQSYSKPLSSVSFASLSGGGSYEGRQMDGSSKKKKAKLG
ncbi:hypothetical protein D9613_004742 [Agrocybe pediades]|uniref:Cyclin-dependent kinase 8 n=1 Tax=Agrocybe pediades TaxID=84607 RepID=A0A8H4VRL9_9AGAR|nr:hypothetical protein D9613_004742 [Agrocybe pediades]